MSGKANGHRPMRFGTKVLSPPAPPWKWELDASGRPKWIPGPPGANWATAFEWELGFGAILQFQMPAVGSDPQEPFGLLPRSERERAARCSAGLRDLYRCNYEYIGRQVKVPPSLPRDRDAAKQRTKEGRLVLHDLGVLPWAAFKPERGRLPKRWWKEDVFLSALAQWQLQPVPDLGQSMVSWAARRAAHAAGQAAAAAEQMHVQLRGAPALMRRIVPR